MVFISRVGHDPHEGVHRIGLQPEYNPVWVILGNGTPPKGFPLRRSQQGELEESLLLSIVVGEINRASFPSIPSFFVVRCGKGGGICLLSVIARKNILVKPCWIMVWRPTDSWRPHHLFTPHFHGSSCLDRLPSFWRGELHSFLFWGFFHDQDFG